MNNETKIQIKHLTINTLYKIYSMIKNDFESKTQIEKHVDIVFAELESSFPFLWFSDTETRRMGKIALYKTIEACGIQLDERQAKGAILANSNDLLADLKLIPMSPPSIETRMAMTGATKEQIFEHDLSTFLETGETYVEWFTRFNAA